MVQSVRQQKRVNLSHWTNVVLVGGVFLFVLLVIGMLWSGYGVKDTFIYSLGYLLVFLAIEFLRRRMRAESTTVITKLFGVVVLFFLLNVAVHIGYQTPSSEIAQPTLDLYFSLSNDSYKDAPVIDGLPNDETDVSIVLITGGEEYDLGVYSDKTMRDESYQDEKFEKYLKGTNDGWAHYAIDLTPFVVGDYIGQEITARFQHVNGVDCVHLKDVSIIVNKIKGSYSSDYVEGEVDMHCIYQSSQQWLEYDFIIQ